LLSLEFEKNGEIITLTENDLFDFRFERGCFSGDTFELGGVNSNLVYCVIDNNTGRFPRGSFANSRLTLYIGGVFCGRYNTELPKRRNGVIELTAYDDMIKLDCEFPDTVGFPQTFWQVYAYCVQAAGLASDFSFDNCVLNALFNNGIISHEYTDYIHANSCRNLVSGMAEWNGGFAYINDDGKLQVDVFSKDVKKTFHSGDLLAFDYSDETVIFSKIKTSQKNKTYEMGDDSGYTLIVRNQYISYGLSDEAFETYFGIIHDYYSGFSLTPMTFTLAEPDFELKIGDRISVVDEEENVTVTGNISKIVVRGNCSMEITCGGFGNIGSVSNYKPTSLSQTAQAKTDAMVNAGGGVGKASDWDNTSEYFNDYANNVAGNKDKAGRNLYATARGKNTKATGPCSIASGCGTTASGEQSAAFGYGTVAKGAMSVTMGLNCSAEGMFSFAGGQSTKATGTSAMAFGGNAVAAGPSSVAINSAATTSNGSDSFAAGSCTTSGNCSFAAGMESKANSWGSIALGLRCETNGNNSVAIGEDCTASSAGSIAIGTGIRTHANGSNLVALGRYNDYNSNDLTYVLVVGNGSGDNSRSNALTIDRDGNVVIAGTLSCGAVITSEASTAAYNADNSVPRTYFIDHAPTADDKKGAGAFLVQYDPDSDTDGSGFCKIVGAYYEKE